MKSEIIERLGQTDMLLPSLIGEGLAANERVKARLSILQAACGRARDPQCPQFTMAEECRAAGIDPMPLETLVNEATVAADERLAAPGLAELGAAIWDDMAAMVRAVKAGDAALGDGALERLASIKAGTALGFSGAVEIAQIARLTGVSVGNGDSLHRLIMDLHKDLNRLAANHAEETIAGAHAYGLRPQDRAPVEAFMRGLEATRKLKFNHPGLATMATCAGERLMIQNDIGETDAHVVVIAVEPDAVTVTYTDGHLARTKFFTGLFRNFAVQWSGLERKSAAGLGDDGVFYLVTGRYRAVGGEARDAFLEAIGSSLVFLIDWNKARKVLREWIANADAIRVLDWSARHRLGHRGFLELGGAELVASAVHHAAPSRIGFGERLDYALGRDAAVDFLKAVLRISTEALCSGSSVRLARERIEAALVGHLQRVEATLFAVVIRQCGLAREIAVGIIDLLGERKRQAAAVDGAALTSRARRIEEKADRIAIEARSEIRRFNADRGVERLVNEIEDAIDELEQAAFVASLLPKEVASRLLDPLIELCGAAISGVEAAAAGAAAAAEVPEGHRVDSEAAHAAVGEMIEAEHRGDAAERLVTTNILSGEFDLKTALSVLDLARALERATDRLAMFGHLLREHVLAGLSA